MQKRSRSILALLALSSLVILNGCSISLGAHGPTVNHPTPTLGQQLIDLQKARDTSVITEAEYQTQRAKLLGNVPPSPAPAP